MHKGALQHRDIIGQWKRGLLEMGEGTLQEKRQKQGQWMNWNGVETRKISWRELWPMDANPMKLIVGCTPSSTEPQSVGGGMCIRKNETIKIFVLNKEVSSNLIMCQPFITALLSQTCPCK